jgi:quinol monooxygenase YgiN
MSTQTHVLLTVRGTLVPRDLEAARALHNETAGSVPGMNAARGLGDLSHQIYSPGPATKQSKAKAGELLFLDRWVEPEGIMKFFSNPEVQAQADRLFSERDASVWMPARGAYAYALPAPRGKAERYVGMVRGPITSPEQAIEVFAAVDRNAQRDARRRGLLSHEIFIKLARPGDPQELLGLDLWCDAEGMAEHYDDATHMRGLGSAFAGAPQASVWEQPRGNWSEW